MQWLQNRLNSILEVHLQQHLRSSGFNSTGSTGFIQLIIKLKHQPKELRPEFYG